MSRRVDREITRVAKPATPSVEVLLAVLLQIASVAALALGTWVAVDGSSAWYAMLGGAAAIIPNGLFATRLAMNRGRPSESYPVVFFLGEFLKIGLTIGLLGAIVRYASPVAWLPLLLGLIVALKAPLFALWFFRERDEPPTPAAGARQG